MHFTLIGFQQLIGKIPANFPSPSGPESFLSNISRLSHPAALAISFMLCFSGNYNFRPSFLSPTVGALSHFSHILLAERILYPSTPVSPFSTSSPTNENLLVASLGESASPFLLSTLANAHFVLNLIKENFFVLRLALQVFGK